MDIQKITQELTRCLGCRAKPCEKACPAGVSPHDFIALAKAQNYQEASKIIAQKNPLPQTCGLVCPDSFCQSACIRRKIDNAIEIPCLQAHIMKKGGLPALEIPSSNGLRCAVIGGGPAGIGATYELISAGWHVDLYEKSSKLGGASRLIPEYRLPKSILDAEINRIINNDRVTVYLNTEITDFETLKTQYDGIILALGELYERKPNIQGEEYCTSYKELLCNLDIPQIDASSTHLHEENFGSEYQMSCKRQECTLNVHDWSADRPPFDNSMPKFSREFSRSGVLGGGEVALDCTLCLKKMGIKEVEMFVRRRKTDMRIMQKDFKELDEYNVKIRELTSVIEITKDNNKYNLTTIQNEIDESNKAKPIANTENKLEGYDIIVTALGSYYPKDKQENSCLCAGDMTGNCGTVVQAVASGKAKAQELIRSKE
jgi:formate dehydrogenase major subunit